MVKKKSIYPYLLVAPTLIIILCVVFIPVVNAIGMSFLSYDLRRPNDIAFVGLANYVAAFKDELFWKALWKTILWVVFGVGFQFVFGFILALLLNRSSEAAVLSCSQPDSMGHTWYFDRSYVEMDV